MASAAPARVSIGIAEAQARADRQIGHARQEAGQARAEAQDLVRAAETARDQARADAADPRIGEVVPRDQGVGVVGAQHPLPVGEGLLEQRDGPVQVPRLL